MLCNTVDKYHFGRTYCSSSKALVVYLSITLHGVTSQNIIILLFDSIKTSNLAISIGQLTAEVIKHWMRWIYTMCESKRIREKEIIDYWRQDSFLEFSTLKWKHGSWVKIYIVYSLIAMTNEPFKTGIWNLIWRYIINIPTYLILLASKQLWTWWGKTLMLYPTNLTGYLYCLHPVMCRDLWYSDRQHNKYFKINQSNCLHWFYLITATCFGPYFGPSSGSFIKYISCYWNILIWVYISVNHYNLHNTYNYY
jgi:hypothetical protein